MPDADRAAATDTGEFRSDLQIGKDIAAARMSKLEAALRLARSQLVTLGGEAQHLQDDSIQRAALIEIDEALKG